MSRACFQFLPPASASHFFTFSSLSRSYFFKFGAVTTATKPCRGLQRSSTTSCARENKPLRPGEILLRLPLNFPPKSERFSKAGWFEIGAFNQRIFNIFCCDIVIMVFRLCLLRHVYGGWVYLKKKSYFIT